MDEVHERDIDSDFIMVNFFILVVIIIKLSLKHLMCKHK